jgi:hypothetical protein
LIKACLEGRDFRLSIFQQRFGLLHIQFIAQSSGKAVGGQAQDFLLSPDVVLGDVQPLLIGAGADVIARDLGHHGNEHIPLAVFSHADLCAGGLDLPAGATENVQLPCGIEVAVVRVIIQRNAKALQWRVEAITIAAITRPGAERWPQSPGNDPALEPSFAHMGLGDLEGKIGLDGGEHEGVEIGITKGSPPMCQICGAVGFAPMHWRGPLGRRSRFRFLIVRPYRAAELHPDKKSRNHQDLADSEKR